MERRKLFFLACLAMAFLPLSMMAQNYAVSLKASTLGANLEVMRSIGEKLNARAGIAYLTLNLDRKSTTEDYDYTADVKLLSLTALVDYFPFQFPGRVTTGLLINANKGDLLLIPSRTYKIGGTTYTKEMLGNVSAEVTVNKFAPYLGIGIGNRLLSKGLDFAFDVGVIYQGKPKVELAAKGLLEPSAEQGPLIEDNLSWFKFYPVVSLGCIYKF